MGKFFSVLNFVFYAIGALAADIPLVEAGFQSSYQQWIDPSNHFVDYFTVDGEQQARVVFIGSSAYSQDGQGQRPTVSEGMGYGLLLSYANDDQKTFDLFLSYILSISNQYGCSAYGNNTCYATAPFMMPWIVNESGKPFLFQSFQGAQAYYSNGSATDADLQIAWALYLAHAKVEKGMWKPSAFKTMKGNWDYGQIFQEMALEIRLNDIDMDNVRYIPGNQWGASGQKVLYPGYFTPQAFVALDTVPAPDVSSKCPDLPDHSPDNSLYLMFKNNIAKTVSIDYMGGNGAVRVDANFIPKPGVANGYVVPAVSTATAIFSSDNEYYANATIQATYYDEKGQPTMKSSYYIEYNNSHWTVTDKGSTEESSYCQSPAGNAVFVCLTAPDIHKVDYTFSAVMTNSLLAIESFQSHYATGLMPNVLHYDGSGYDQWSESFSYDACRFPLWTGYFVETNPDHPLASSLKIAIQDFLGNKGIANFVKSGTLPSGGIDAIKQQAIGSWDISSSALNAPVLAAAELMKDADLYNELSAGVFQYDITKNQPSANDAQGDSSPYFNAVMVLLTRAVLENRLVAP
jgi:endo-1,4-beta-D-glucanase Y